jgi:hypothetical protein
MGVEVSHSFEDAFTPRCNDCGVALCWDISILEYIEDKGFWDSWRCDICNPDYGFAYARWKIENARNKQNTSGGLPTVTSAT